MEWVRYFFVWLAVFVIGSVILTFLYNSGFILGIYKTGEKVNEKIGSSLDKIQTPSEISCQSKAAALIPNYLFVGKMNQWKDGEPVYFSSYGAFRDILRVRRGSAQGENVNLFYLGDELYSVDNFTEYSKQIVDSSGKILGTRHFKADFSLQKYGSPITFNGWVDKENTEYHLNWSGFTEEIKDIIGIETINFTWEFETWNYYIYHCEDSLKNESGEILCGFPEQWNNWASKEDVKAEFEFKASNIDLARVLIPDIQNIQIYKIADYKIYDCEWVINE